MSSDKSCAALFFDAPMVSFGVDSKFDRRDTLTFPSRSVVTGLVAAAMGIRRDDRARLAELADLDVVSVVFLKSPGRIEEDYHTVGGGYEKTHAKFIPAKADGKPRGTVQTWRYFISGSRSAAVVSGDSALIDRIAAALRDPVWGGWIGRKCCIPASPVFQGVFPSEEDALGKLRALAGCGDSDSMQIFRECALTDPEAALYPDVPLDFAGRSFAPRALKEERHGG